MHVLDEGFRRDPGRDIPLTVPLPIENLVYVKFNNSDEDIGERITSGLNGGFELDDDTDDGVVESSPFIFEGLPNFDLDVVAAVGLESRISDLQYLANDIERSSGMCRSYALEAEKLLPGFGGVPHGYYSTCISATRFRLSLEELSKGIWVLIAAAAAAAIAIIIKIFTWISKGSESENTGSKQSAKAAVDEVIKKAEDLPENLHEAAKDLERADGILKDTNITLKDSKGHDFKCMSMQSAVDHLFTDADRYSRAKKLLETRDPIFHDIINNGPYSVAMQAIGHSLLAINDTLRLKLNVIDEIITKDLGSYSKDSEMRHARTLDILSKPIDITFQSRTMALKNAGSYLESVLHEVKGKEVNADITIDRLFTTMSTAYSSKNIKRIFSDLKHSLATFGELEKRLDKIRDVTRDLAADGTPGASTQGIGSQLRVVLMVTTSDIIGFGALAQGLKAYVSQMEYLATEALGFSLEIVRKLAHEMRITKQEVPPAWLEVIADLNRRLKAVTGGYYRGA